MSLRRTTTCCCLGAAFVAATVSIHAQKVAHAELGLFPVRPDWTLALKNLLVAPPALRDDEGFFPIDGDRIVAYDLTTGAQRWLVDGHPLTRPAVAPKLLFLAEATELRALDRQTGATRWRLPFNEPLATPLVWDNGWLIVATEPGTILAFRADDGQLIWRQDLGTPAGHAPALAADRVYVPLADGRIVALQIEGGQPLWERWIGGLPGDLLATEDRLYVGSTDNYFYGIRTKNGEVQWRYRTGADVVGVPVVDERLAYFVSLDNVLRAIDKVSGVQHWKRTLSLRPTDGPVRAGGILLVTGLSPKIPAFAMKDGAPAGEIGAGALLYAPPHVVLGGVAPRVALVTRDLTESTIVKALVRNVDPDPSRLGALPNPITVAAPKTEAPPGSPPGK